MLMRIGTLSLICWQGSKCQVESAGLYLSKNEMNVKITGENQAAVTEQTLKPALVLGWD